MPPDLLWLPYFILAILLIFFFIGSFAHYHIKNRGKYAHREFRPPRAERYRSEHNPRPTPGAIFTINGFSGGGGGVRGMRIPPSPYRHSEEKFSPSGWVGEEGGTYGKADKEHEAKGTNLIMSRFFTKSGIYTNRDSGRNEKYPQNSSFTEAGSIMCEDNDIFDITKDGKIVEHQSSGALASWIESSPRFGVSKKRLYPPTQLDYSPSHDALPARAPPSYAASTGKNKPMAAKPSLTVTSPSFDQPTSVHVGNATPGFHPYMEDANHIVTTSARVELGHSEPDIRMLRRNSTPVMTVLARVDDGSPPRRFPSPVVTSVTPLLDNAPKYHS